MGITSLCTTSDFSTVLMGTQSMSDNKNEVVNLNELSMDELKELANKEAEEIEPVETKPLRDEKGRFAKVEEAEVEDEPQKTVYRQVIDLGDSGGIQVFEADSQEELVNKLVEAQRNATKKIREQADQLKKIEAEKAKAAEQQRQLTEDEEFVLSQEMMSNPSQAIKKAFKQMTGYDITEFRTVAERAKAFEAAQQQQAETQKQEEAANLFVSAHPEYVANAKNGQRLHKAVNLLIAEAQNQGQELDYSSLLEQAYRDLSESGLLELKSQDDVTVEHEATGTTQHRIDAVEEVAPVQRKKAGGLSQRSFRTAAPQPIKLSQKELYSMSLDQLRELAESGN